MGPYRTPGSVLADEPKKKLEKLTFTPTRLIEIERRGEFDEEPWGNVLLKPGREVTFAPCSDWFDDDDWYIDDKSIHRVLHYDVERVHAQLSMEADVAKAAPAAESVPDRLLRIAREAGYEPTGVEHISVDRWMVLFERPTLGTYVRGVCVGSGKDDKNTLDMLRDYAGPDNQPEAVRNRKLNAGPCDTRHPPQEHEMDPRGEYCVRCLRTRSYVEATKPEALELARKLAMKPMLYVKRGKVEMDAQDRVSRWDMATIVQHDPEKRPTLEVNGIKVVADPNVPQDEMWFIGTDGTRAIHPKAFALAKAELDKRATVAEEPEYAVRVAGHWRLPTGLYSNARVYLPTYRDDMVSTVIASQVAAGGVDTEGTRAEAERYCAMLAGCVCEGMRATTWRSRYRETVSDYEGAVTAEIIDGHIAKPLGRP